VPFVGVGNPGAADGAPAILKIKRYNMKTKPFDTDFENGGFKYNVGVRF